MLSRKSRIVQKKRCVNQQNKHTHATTIDWRQLSFAFSRSAQIPFTICVCRSGGRRGANGGSHTSGFFIDENAHIFVWVGTLATAEITLQTHAHTRHSVDYNYICKWHNAPRRVRALQSPARWPTERLNARTYQINIWLTCWTELRQQINPLMLMRTKPTETLPLILCKNSISMWLASS